MRTCMLVPELLATTGQHDPCLAYTKYHRYHIMIRIRSLSVLTCTHLLVLAPLSYLSQAIFCVVCEFAYVDNPLTAFSASPPTLHGCLQPTKQCSEVPSTEHTHLLSVNECSLNLYSSLLKHLSSEFTVCPTATSAR